MQRMPKEIQTNAPKKGGEALIDSSKEPSIASMYAYNIFKSPSKSEDK
jgi:hypothetical protein